MGKKMDIFNQNHYIYETMSYHLHSHLREVKEFLEDSDTKFDKIETTLAQWLDSAKTQRLLVRHEDEFDEIVLKVVGYNMEYRLSCREFTYERLLHFKKACARLKCWLQMQEKKTTSSRSGASGPHTSLYKGE